MLISHDIGAIASISERIGVFYAGRIIEHGPAEKVLRQAAMPYTRALLNALPRAGATRLESIGGQPPDFANLPEGCSFRPRCPLRFDKCLQEPGLLPVEPDHGAACWRAGEVATMPPASPSPRKRRKRTRLKSRARSIPDNSARMTSSAEGTPAGRVAVALRDAWAKLRHDLAREKRTGRSAGGVPQDSPAVAQGDGYTPCGRTLRPAVSMPNLPSEGCPDGRSFGGAWITRGERQRFRNG